MVAHNGSPEFVRESTVDDDRRKFLATCGKFALVTPPALTVLLSTSLNSSAIAHSGGRSDHDKDSRENHKDGDNDSRGHHGDDRGGDFWGWLERLLDKVF